MLPFTSAQFFGIFAAYNGAIWPAQVIAYGLGLLAIACLVRPGLVADRIISGVLALMWTWTGIAYQGYFFSAINRTAFLFAALFVAQGIILFVSGVIQGGLRFGYARELRPSIGVALIFYAAVLYPLVGMALGHSYLELPHFGVTPCPVALFSFGWLLLLKSPVKWWVAAIPVAWSLIGGTAAFLLEVPQDCLLAGGPATIVLLAKGRPSLVHW